MAIVQRIELGAYTLEIEADPDGYSDGTWGYIVCNANNDIWFDGGFPSRERAKEAGRTRIARIEV
jgi:hypothetical protein